MFLSEFAEMSWHGVRLPMNAIRRVQIGPGAPCWGVPLPHWQRAAAGAKRPVDDFPAHIAISPFHPRTWPCLVSISLKLEDKPGTVASALQAIGAGGANVLTIVCAPSGHNHETLDVVCTLPTLMTRLGGVTERAVSCKTEKALLKLVSHEWSCPMLQALSQLRKTIVESDESLRFLRPRFKEKPTRGKTHEFLIHHAAIRGVDLQREAKLQDVPAIRVSWLQYPAFYYFHRTPSPPMQLRCNGDLIEPVADSRSAAAYRLALPSACGPNHKSPVRVLASVDPRAHIIRVMPLRAREKPHVLVSLTCRTDSPGDSASQGALHAIARAVATKKGSIWHMSNDIVASGESTDRADIRLVVTDTRGADAPNRTPLDRELAAALDGDHVLKGFHGVTLDRPATISPFSCGEVFVSKRQSWWTKSEAGKEFAKTIHDVALALGYTISEYPPPDHQLTTNDPRGDMVDRIRRASGFLLVVPQESTKQADGLQFLLWELGIAIGAGRPWAVAVEKGRSNRTIKGILGDIRNHIRVLHDNIAYEFFDSRKPKEGTEAVLRRLDLRIREGLGHP